MKPGALTRILCLITMAFAEGAPKVKMQTFTYKKVSDLEIKADVHRPGDEVRRPVLVYIHGGALINGGKGEWDHSAIATFIEGMADTTISGE